MTNQNNVFRKGKKKWKEWELPKAEWWWPESKLLMKPTKQEKEKGLEIASDFV